MFDLFKPEIKLAAHDSIFDSPTLDTLQLFDLKMYQNGLLQIHYVVATDQCIMYQTWAQEAEDHKVQWLQQSDRRVLESPSSKGQYKSCLIVAGTSFDICIFALEYCVGILRQSKSISNNKLHADS